MIDKAIDQVASLIFSESDRCILQDIDYVFVRAHVRVDLTRGYPSIVTERTISARSEGIDHLDERVYFPRMSGTALNLLALEGCSVADLTHVGPGVWSVRLRLSRRLTLGDQHTFSVSVRLPDHGSLEPVVGFLPHTTSFDATIEFNFGDHAPSVLEQFTAPPPIPLTFTSGDTTIVTPTTRRHTINLPQMRPGLCYGVRWEWPPESELAVPVL